MNQGELERLAAVLSSLVEDRFPESDVLERIESRLHELAHLATLPERDRAKLESSFLAGSFVSDPTVSRIISQAGCAEDEHEIQANAIVIAYCLSTAFSRDQILAIERTVMLNVSGNVSRDMRAGAKDAVRELAQSATLHPHVAWIRRVVTQRLS